MSRRQEKRQEVPPTAMAAPSFTAAAIQIMGLSESPIRIFVIETIALRFLLLGGGKANECGQTENDYSY